MKRISFILFMCLLHILSVAASTFSLNVEVTPTGAAGLNTQGGTYEEGKEIYLAVYPHTGFIFKGWYAEEEIVSSSNGFYYTMPSHNTTIQARFEYDPVAPPDPDQTGYTYTTLLKSRPEGGGSFNRNSITLEEGREAQIYAYNNTGFRFLRWEDEDGKTLSEDRDFSYIMPKGGGTLYGVFDYDPEPPSNPLKNYWNKQLGEVIIDDFTPGNLTGALSSLIDGYNSNEVSMITVAGVMSTYDFGIANNYSSCTLLDLSRVTGITEIPSYAFDYTALETVILPATIEKIGTRAFDNCKQLAAISIYAMTPPALESNVFQGVSDGLIVYVPAAALSQYQDSDMWKDFTILPIQEDIRNLTVSLPSNVKTDPFARMWLEIRNTKNGQKLHYVMNDRQSYTFANIIRNTTWDVTLRNERGDIFGQISNVEVKDEDVAVEFKNLSLPQTIYLTVVTEEGEDISDKVNIGWTDASGNYLGQSSTLAGLPAGMKVGYTITLPQTLALKYVIPEKSLYTVMDSGNKIECKLSPIPQVQLSGKIKDSSTGLPLSGTVVTASQTFGSKYSQTVTCKTDRNGEYKLTVFKVPTSLTASASDYVSHTLICDDLMSGQGNIVIPEIGLKPIAGAVINLSFSYRRSVAEGVAEEKQDWYENHSNISYSIFNKAKNRPLTQFSVQYPTIVLLEEVAESDILEITATSLSGDFMPLVAKVEIDKAQKGEAKFEIVELGGFNAKFVKNGNSSVSGSLYDADGKLYKTYNYDNSALSVNGLKDGKYTLVTMGNSKLFNNIYSLDQYEETGLSEGIDYVSKVFEVKSGYITEVAIESVPTLNEAKLYYTGDNTSFTVNKPSIVAGNYLTLTGKIDFKPSYVSEISNLSLIVDLPEECDFVENSVMVGNNTSSYTFDGTRLTVPMSRITDRVRFCVIPTLGGEYSPSAFAQFNLNGETITQPIGAANYTAKNLSISAPSVTSKSSVTISGTAIGASDIEIYDNNVLIGKTKSMPNGLWDMNCDLTDTFSFSNHKIYAKVKTKSNLELISESVNCIYDSNAIEPKSVAMSFYNGWLHKQVDVTWDFVNKTTSSNSYMFYTATDITFTVDFTDDDPTLVQDVELYVFTSDGDCVQLTTEYNEDINKYVATKKFQSDKLPVNVSVSYNIGHREKVDMTEAFQAEVALIKEIGRNALSKSDLLDLEVIMDENNKAIFKTVVNSGNEEDYFEIEELDYNQALLQLKSVQFDYEETENGYIYTRMEESEDLVSLVFIDKSEKIAYSIKLYDTNSQTRAANTRAGNLNLGKFLSKVAQNGAVRDLYVNGNWIGTCNMLYSGINDMLGLNKYAGCRSFNMYFDIMDAYLGELENLAKILTKALTAQCQDGTYRLSEEDRRKYAEQIMNFDSSISRIYDTFLSYVELYKSKLACSAVLQVAKTCLGAAISGSAEKGIKFLSNPEKLKFLQKWITTEARQGYLENSLGLGFGLIMGKITDILDPEEADFQKTEDEMNQWMADSRNNMLELYNAILKNIKGSYKNCVPKDEKPVNPPVPPTNPINPIHDPSGYVYEAVHSNRIEGVTATVFYKEMVEDMYGDLHENVVIWDAEEYAQKNPLFTDEFGMYAWDVPQGLWQVRFEKEGYETSFSEWLPVPPPQLEVNIAIKQNVQPNVRLARAFEDAVEVEFDKYMQPESISSENIIVLAEDKTIAGSLVLLNEEETYEESGETFASKVRFNANEPFSTKEVTLLVKNRVKSYADVRMQDDYMQSFVVEPEIRKIECDSVIDVAYGGSRVMKVHVIPAIASEGKTLNVFVASALTISTDTQSVVLDKDGSAEIVINGDLPGSGALQFAIEGYDLSEYTIVNVRKDFNKVATPKISIASGSTVDQGTEVYLSCDTEGATIIYTLDGSCPCDDTDARKEYDGSPIVINEDMTIKAIAYAPDMYESEIATFVYYIADTGVEGILLDNQVKLYPLPMREELNISAGDTLIKRVSFTNLSGATTIMDVEPSRIVTIDVSRFPAGIYMVTIETDRGETIRKVMKVK